MTDFYALLKQSIIERDIRDARDRETVYAQARQAIIRQLWAFRPPLAADEIDTRVGAYDQAVERIENDLRTEFARATAPPHDHEPADAFAPELDPPIPELGPLAEIEAVREDDVDDDIDAPPLAAWHDDHAADAEAVEADDHEDAYDEPEAPPSRRQAVAAQRRSRDAGAPVPDERSGQHARWSESAEIVPRNHWWSSFSDRDKIQMLAGAITALVIALGALAGFLIFARPSSDAVTVGIATQQAVSDAATAARIAANPVDAIATYTVFEGRDPTIFVTTPDNPVRFASADGYARVSSSISAGGVKVRIGPGLASRLAGQPIRVTVVARSSPDSGAASMRFAYQSGVAISHWQTANLAPEYEAVGMLWRPPAMRTDASGDYLIIEPGIPGDGTSVDIQSIKVDVLPPGTS